MAAPLTKETSIGIFCSEKRETGPEIDKAAITFPV